MGHYVPSAGFYISLNLHVLNRDVNTIRTNPCQHSIVWQNSDYGLLRKLLCQVCRTNNLITANLQERYCCVFLNVSLPWKFTKWVGSLLNCNPVNSFSVTLHLFPDETFFAPVTIKVPSHETQSNTSRWHCPGSVWAELQLGSHRVILDLRQNPGIHSKYTPVFLGEDSKIKVWHNKVSI